jgi:hypothetical protein
MPMLLDEIVNRRATDRSRVVQIESELLSNLVFEACRSCGDLNRPGFTGG